jgi:aerobic carbon-monoxide dehydrogenase medium subunit
VKPAPFTLHRPTTIAEAAGLLAEHGDEAKPLAGGQSLVPMLALRLTRFEHLVDLNRVDELRNITTDDAALRIGAGVRQATVGTDPTVARDAPLFSRATPLIGHFQIRNRGTIGGSLAHADPASEYPAVAAALDAELEVTSRRGTRRVPAADFFVGTWMTVVEPDELLSAVVVPRHNGQRGVAIDEVARRHGDFALTGAVAVIDLDGDDRVQHAAIAMFGMSSTPLRAPAGEQALTGRARTELDLAEIAQLAVRDANPPDDVHASAAYRTRAGAHVVERVLTQAFEEATSAAR